MENEQMIPNYKSANGFLLYLAESGEWYLGYNEGQDRDLTPLDPDHETSILDRGVIAPITNIETGEILKAFELSWDFNNDDGLNHVSGIYFAVDEDQAVKQWNVIYEYGIEDADILGLNEIKRICTDEYLERSYHVTMPDGDIYAVPVKVIAENRANYYKKEFNDDLVDSLEQDTLPLFKDDWSEVRDWAQNNMDWSDVAKYAVLLPKEPQDIDYQEGWVNGESYIK